MKNAFKTKYNAKPSPPEKHGGQSVTERAGYIPAKARIELLMQAGIRLREWRSEQFDFASEDEVDEDFIDPTRRPGFDLADATQVMQELEERRKDGARREAEELAEKSAKEPAPEHAPGLSSAQAKGAENTGQYTKT